MGLQKICFWFNGGGASPLCLFISRKSVYQNIITYVQSKYYYMFYWLSREGGITQNCKLETVCVQLALTVELMVTSIDVWSSQLSASHLAYLLLSDIHRSIVQLVKELAKDLEIMWQVCAFVY